MRDSQMQIRGRELSAQELPIACTVYALKYVVLS